MLTGLLLTAVVAGERHVLSLYCFLKAIISSQIHPKIRLNRARQGRGWQSTCAYGIRFSPGSQASAWESANALLGGRGSGAVPIRVGFKLFAVGGYFPIRIVETSCRKLSSLPSQLDSRDFCRCDYPTPKRRRQRIAILTPWALSSCAQSPRQSIIKGLTFGTVVLRS
jgi:hypothetical protein